MLMIRRGLLADARGVAAVEFALILPILIMLYFGVVELTQGVMAEQRNAHTASTVGDLVSQSASITASGVDDIFTVGSALVYPYPTTTLGMRVSSVTESAAGVVSVDWSRASGMTALAKQATVSDPNLANVISKGQSAIVAESQYTYTSVFSYIMPKPVTFDQKYYLRPRLSSQVTCSDC
ncbi:MAG TPA: TadE/TadG family type IV pilus assembly protein [Caulobacteraceae bacterium]|jgi:Flp pilus assembly protein TadG